MHRLFQKNFGHICSISGFERLDGILVLEWAGMNYFAVSAPAVAVLLLAPVVQAFQSTSAESLPYIAVHDPRFISAKEATFMHAGDRIIGITSGSIAKAYPAGILSQHGLVEDRLASGPIAVTW
jgi:hypothetical protein